MAKKFKFEFEKGGTLIADACEKEAPVSVRIFENYVPILLWFTIAVQPPMN